MENAASAANALRVEPGGIARRVQQGRLSYTAVVLALNTAMRKDEIRRLQWKQMDLFEHVLTVIELNGRDGQI